MQRHPLIRPSGPPTASTDIPILETDRLRLRAFTLDDLPAACAMWADPEVVRFIGGEPRSESDVWLRVSRSFGHWALLGYGYLAVADRTTDSFLGQIGFMEGLRELEPSHVGTPEAGWAFARSAWGRGIASEALGALVGWGDRALVAPRTVCMVDPDHPASIRLAEKNGYRRYADGTMGGESGSSPTVLMERRCLTSSS